MAILQHDPCTLFLGDLNSVDSSLSLTTTERKSLHLLLKLLLDFHNINHRISSSRKHDNNRSIVHRVLNDFFHIERRRNNIVLSHFFFIRNKLLDHHNDLIRSEKANDNSFLQNSKFVLPLSRPNMLITSNIRTVIEIFPEFNVLFHVKIKTLEDRNFSRQLHETSPRFIGEPSAFTSRVRSIKSNRSSTSHQETYLRDVNSSFIS